MTQTILRTQLNDRLTSAQSTVLVEALPKRHFDAQHLPGALNIPHDQIKDMAPDLLRDKQAFIVVYCASTECQNSKIAADALTQMGYTNVYEYVDGKKDWIEAGLATEGNKA